LRVLVIDQPVDVVVGGMGPGARFQVNGVAEAEVVRYSDVKIPGAAGKNVDPEIVFALHWGRIAGQRQEQKQIPFGNDKGGMSNKEGELIAR
jgi:hypothetical protein